MLYILFIMACIAVVAYLVTTRKYANRVAMLWVIATAVKHDMPLPDLIRAQAIHSWGKRKRMLFEIASDLRSGTSLAEVVDTYREIVPEQGRLAIHIGSDSGTLDQSLDAALEYIERRPHEVIRDFQMIFFYLAAVAIAWVGVVSFIMYWIVPKFEDIFLGFDLDIPETTMLFIDLADFWVAYFFLFPLTLIVLVPLGIFFASFVTGGLELPDKVYTPFRLEFTWKPALLSRWISYQLLKQGVRFTPQRATADILRYLGVVAQADQPILNVIDTFSRHHKAADIRARMKKVKERLSQGGELWSLLAEKGFLSKQKATLLRTAEISGDLPYALKGKTLQYEATHHHRMTCLMDYLRVITILILCSLTAFFAVSMFLPLVDLMNKLS